MAKTQTAPDSLAAKLDALYVRACNIRCNGARELSSDLCAMVQSTEMARDTKFVDKFGKPVLSAECERLLSIVRDAIEACDRAIAKFAEQACDDADEASDREVA
jgi:hypothetical protein